MDCTITPDQNLIGIGIRVPIYILSLILPVVRLDYSGSFGIAIVNATLAFFGLVLFCVSAVSVFQNRLDLFHGLCVSFLLSIAWPIPKGPYGHGMFTAGGSGSSHRSRTWWSMALKTFIGLPIFAPLPYYILLDMVYGNTESFGPRSECNDQTLLVIFGAPVPATAPVLPWLVSIFLGTAFLVTMSQFLKQAGATTLQELGISKILVTMDPRRFAYADNRLSENIQLNIMDNTLFQLTASMASRVYFIGCLEGMINQNQLEAGYGHGLTYWHIPAILGATLALVVGWRGREIDGEADEDEDESYFVDDAPNPEYEEWHQTFNRMAENPRAAFKLHQSTLRGLQSGIELVQMQLHAVVPPGEHFFLFILAAGLDMAYSALAGLLAALAAKSASGGRITGQVGNIGALAGVVKSTTSNISLLISRAGGSNVSTLFIYVASSLIIPFIVTAVTTQRAIHEVPDALTTAALAAGAPLILSNAMHSPSVVIDVSLFFSALVFDTLSGYTFARVAENHGYNSLTGGAGVVAGLVFGLVLYSIKFIGLCFVTVVESIRIDSRR